VAAVATGLDPGHLRHLLGVRQGELEVLDLVPVMGERLRHHRLLVLAGDGGVALGAHLVGFEVVVRTGAEGGVARRPGGVGDDECQCHDSQHGQKTLFHGVLLAAPRYAFTDAEVNLNVCRKAQ